MAVSRSLSFNADMASMARVTESATKSAIDILLILTARLSGLRRLPLQVWHLVADM